MSRLVLRRVQRKNGKKERKKEIIFYVVLSIIWMQTMGFELSASLYFTYIQTCIEFLSHEPSSANIVVRHVSLHTLSKFDIYLDMQEFLLHELSSANYEHSGSTRLSLHNLRTFDTYLDVNKVRITQRVMSRT